MGKNHICKKCGGIAGWDSYFQSWICTRCGNEERKPITNANRIRSMTDEELAWELARICRMPFYKDDSEIDEYEVDCWANWLKQEVEPDADL